MEISVQVPLLRAPLCGANNKSRQYERLQIQIGGSLLLRGAAHALPDEPSLPQKPLQENYQEADAQRQGEFISEQGRFQGRFQSRVQGRFQGRFHGRFQVSSQVSRQVSRQVSWQVSWLARR